MPSSVVSSDPNTLNSSAKMPPIPVTYGVSPSGASFAWYRSVSTIATIGDVPSGAPC